MDDNRTHAGLVGYIHASCWEGTATAGAVGYKVVRCHTRQALNCQRRIAGWSLFMTAFPRHNTKTLKRSRTNTWHLTQQR